MATTYTLIESRTFNSQASSTTFSNIPQNYSDLIIKVFMRNASSAAQGIYIQPNGLNTSMNTYGLYGANGWSQGRINNAAFYVGTSFGTNGVAESYAQSEIYVANYSSTTKHKAGAGYNQAPNASSTNQWINLNSFIYPSTTPITSLVIVPTGDGVAFSTISLYGISR